MDSRTNNTAANARPGRRAGGFTLLEVLTALGILALVSSSVLVVIDRCLASAADSSLRMEAFQLARENMEKVLVSDSVEEGVEYGTSEKYSEMTWETLIEAFPEPVEGKMWVRAVCSAYYEDAKGQKQKVELVHWITELTDQQAGQLMDEEDMAKLEVEQLLATPEEAAKYARVSVDMLDQWVQDGLLTTENDEFIKYNLDLFVQSKGNPTAEEKARQVESIKELAMTLRSMQNDADEGAGVPGKDSLTGLPSKEQGLEKMNPGQIMESLKQRRK